MITEHSVNAFKCSNSIWSGNSCSNSICCYIYHLDAADNSQMLEDMGRRLQEFEDSMKESSAAVQKYRSKADALQAKGGTLDVRKLEKVKALLEETESLHNSIIFLKDFADGLVVDAPEGTDTMPLVERTDKLAQEWESLVETLRQQVGNLDSANVAVEECKEHAQELGDNVHGLMVDLHSMSPVARDVDSIHSQLDELGNFMTRMRETERELQSAEIACAQLQEEGFVSDSNLLDKVE